MGTKMIKFMAGAAVFLFTITTNIQAQTVISEEKLKELQKQSFEKNHLRLSYKDIHSLYKKWEYNNMDSDFVLLLQIALQESRLNPQAVSKSYAIGLTQILRSTHKEIQHRILKQPTWDQFNLFNPTYALLNTEIYLRWLWKNGKKKRRIKDIIAKKGGQFALLMMYKEGIRGASMNWNTVQYKRGWKYATEVQGKFTEANDILEKSKHIYINHLMGKRVSVR